MALPLFLNGGNGIALPVVSACPGVTLAKLAERVRSRHALRKIPLYSVNIRLAAAVLLSAAGGHHAAVHRFKREGAAPARKRRGPVMLTRLFCCGILAIRRRKCYNIKTLCVFRRLQRGGLTTVPLRAF